MSSGGAKLQLHINSNKNNDNSLIRNFYGNPQVSYFKVVVFFEPNSQL